MRSLNVSITEPQFARLAQLQIITKLSKSDHVRRALDLYFQEFDRQHILQQTQKE